MENNILVKKATHFLENEYNNLYKNDKLKKLPNDDFFNKVFDHSWKDATIYVRKKKNDNQKKIMDNKDAIKKFIKNKLKENDFQSLLDFDEYSANGTFGFWQKLVNMLFKNLYCFKLCGYDIDFDKSFFESCHCPIDSISATWIFREYPNDDEEILHIALSIATSGAKLISGRKITWNNMSNDEYKIMQEAVKEICKKDDRINCPLEFDILYWKS